MRIGIVIINSDECPFDEKDYEGRLGVEYLDNAKKGLEELGHDVQIVEVNPLTINLLKKAKFDVLLNFADSGFFNDPQLEPHVTTFFDVIKVPYTGSNYMTLSLCLNKALTKKLLMYHRINTPKFQEVRDPEERVSRRLQFPLIVKPSMQDGSIGIGSKSVVRDENALKEKIKEVIDTYKQPALVEEYIDGREIYVAVLGNGDDLEILPPSEISFDKLPESFEKICTYKAKWHEKSVEYKTTPSICPAKLDPELYKELVEMAVNAYRVLGCRDYARIDFRVDKEGVPYILEVNPNPDISDDAGLTKMASKIGLDYAQLLERIIKICAQRYGIKEELQVGSEEGSKKE